MRAPSWLKEIDHTGDTGIVVVAADLASLFERAAWGMFTILTDVENIDETISRDVEVDGTDRPDLLVRWLSDLNYLHLTEHILLSRFKIREMDDRHLAATAWGEEIDAGRHVVYTEVKAVTYHGLEIRQTNGGWSAQVIFDL